MRKLRSSRALARAFALCACALSIATQLGCGGDDGGSPPGVVDCDANAPIPDTGEAGKIFTFAGTGNEGFVRENIQRLECRFSQLCDISFRPDGTMYVVDWNNHMIRHVRADGSIRTVVGVTPPFPGDGPQPEYEEYDDTVDWVDARLCKLNHPTELNPLPDGDFILTAWHNHKLRVFDPELNLEKVYCGRTVGYAGDCLPGQDPDTECVPYHDPGVKLGFPNQAELGPDGHLYILDQLNQRIRRIKDFMTDPDGIIETVAGTGDAGFNGDKAPLETQFNFDNSSNPRISGGMYVGGTPGNPVIYVSDSANHLLRAIDLSAGQVTTLAGIPGSPGSGGDGGPGTSAQLSWPLDLEIGPDGRLYVADEDNHAIRAYDFDTKALSTVAGTLGITSSYECSRSTSSQIGDGKLATRAYLRNPRGIAFGPADGRLYIADTFHNRVRVMTLESNS